MTEQLTLMWILRKTLRGRCCHEAHTALGDRGPWRLLGGKAGPGAQAAGPPAPSIAFLCRARSHSFLLWNLIFSKSAATLNHTKILGWSESNDSHFRLKSELSHSEWIHSFIKYIRNLC